MSKATMLKCCIVCAIAQISTINCCTKCAFCRHSNIASIQFKLCPEFTVSQVQIPNQKSDIQRISHELLWQIHKFCSESKTMHIPCTAGQLCSGCIAVVKSNESLNACSMTATFQFIMLKLINLALNLSNMSTAKQLISSHHFTPQCQIKK